MIQKSKMFCNERHHSNKKGFSVLELSVVLMIIGLIVGTTIVGYESITNAKLLKTIDQISQISEAMHQFQDKYQVLPGDMHNATGYWGTSVGCPYPGSVKQKTTCNGDGNGFVDTAPEQMAFWQHLANAGFINGTYSGAYTPVAPTPDVDCMAMPLGGCWGLGFISATAASWQLWQGNIASAPKPVHILSLGKHLTSHSYANPVSPITGAQVFNIDTKIDDGLPATGKVTTRPGYCLIDALTCAVSDCITAVSITGKYNLAPTREGTCNLDYNTDY